MTDKTPENKARLRAGTPLAEAQMRQQVLGSQLRQLFDEVVNEPVPDEFLEILSRAAGEAPPEES